MYDVHNDDVDVLVIGAGQAGLATGYHLARTGRRFLILEGSDRLGSAWESRWDSLRLFTPSQYDSLPGLPLPASRDHHPGKDEVAAYLRKYAHAFALPIRLGTRVSRLTRDRGRFVARTSRGTISADAVVVATGPFQRPWRPAVAADFPADVYQLHSADYRNPASLPEGLVLVVGGGNSGYQIAEELSATHEVALSVGERLRSMPQRLLGRDIFWWLRLLGYTRVTIGSRLGRKLAQRDGLIGVSEARLRRLGVDIRSRLEGVDEGRAMFADGSAFSPRSVVWATGYRSDYSWIEVTGALDALGTPVHNRGVSPVPGLAFVGLPWQHTRGSALLGGVGADAEHVAHLLASRLQDRADVSGTSAADETMPLTGRSTK